MNLNDISEAISVFSEYADEIQNIISEFASAPAGEKTEQYFQDKIPAILNGRTTRFLRERVNATIRKEAGIFFTDSLLSDRVASRLASAIEAGAVICDPACGAGNLLISCAKYLPRGRNFLETIKIWSDKIIGYDLYKEFIQTAQFRLLLHAASYHNDNAKLSLPSDTHVFKKIKVGNFFKNLTSIEKADCVVVNPPFGHSKAPTECEWGTGKIQLAGLFFMELLSAAKQGQRIVAILPDVLRSGTRYYKWREIVSDNCKSIDGELIGRFDKQTDVDVFVLDVIKGNPTDINTFTPLFLDRNVTGISTLSDFYEVRVGTVVPHRHPEVGPAYPFIHSRNAKDWNVIKHINDKRRFSGRVFAPPFVVIRRTSSPEDNIRIAGAIIAGKDNVAVENHLIVVRPLDNLLASCKKLANILKEPQATDWLNQRIRCRHVTASAIKEMPLPLTF